MKYTEQGGNWDCGLGAEPVCTILSAYVQILQGWCNYDVRKVQLLRNFRRLTSWIASSVLDLWIAAFDSPKKKYRTIYGMHSNALNAARNFQENLT
jgi:hypothetical protein